MKRTIIEEKPPTSMMPLIIYEFPEYKELNFLPLGDVHWDAISCMRELFKKVVDEIRTKNYYTGLVGDIFDKLFFNRQDKRERDINLNQAFEEVLQILLPIKDRILFINEGNHDRGLYKIGEFSLAEHLADDLGVPFIKGAGFVNIRLNAKGHRYGRPRLRDSYIIYTTHGWGGGRRAGNAIKKIEELITHTEGADICLIGHLHVPEYRDFQVVTVDRQNNIIKERHIYGVALGSFQHNPLYVQQTGRAPGGFSNFLIQFCKDKKIKITVSPML